MNDLLEQFLVECREIVDAATADLLALESAPSDKDRIDGAFRGFHTLKGAAGIVDFPAMGRVLHAAETVLASVRAGDRAVSGDLIGDCLACLDQVLRWLDETEAAGDIPVSSGAAADALVARLTSSDQAPHRQAGASDPAGTSDEVTPAWVTSLLARYSARQANPRTPSPDAPRSALRYIPDADCFFAGEDPLAVIAALPGILALEVTPREGWPTLDELHPFDCDLIITVLTSSPAEALKLPPRLSGQIEILPLAEAADAVPHSRPEAERRTALTPPARAILREQMLLAEGGGADNVSAFTGRLASAARVAANVLRYEGGADAAEAIMEAAAQSRRDGDGGVFIAALRSILEPPTGQPEGETPEGETPEGETPEGEIPEGETPEGGIQEQSSGRASEQTGPQPASEPREPNDEQPIAAAQDPAPRTQTARALRVDAERIDALVNLAGELTVAKNAVGHTARLAREGADPDILARALKDQHALLDRLVAELRRSVLAIRVLPLRHVFQHFPRLVREIARDLGKPVRLVIEGETTEADKATVEALFEPLLHVLRNALDHGIETEADRLAAGKPPAATLRLSAMRDGDRVIVEVSDDGRGIDTANIRRIAIRDGIATEAALQEMTDQAAIELIFTPGFSTATAVTDVSGRGVGMDAVRAAIARLGGRVEVRSQPGAGTSVTFTLPFSVMMLRVMTVEAGGQAIGIPIDAVVETVRVPRDRIFRLGAAEAIVLRDRTVPLLRLADTLGLPTPPGASVGDARIVIVSAGDQSGSSPMGANQFAANQTGANQTGANQTGMNQIGMNQIAALEVEGFGERMDVVLKPMEGLLAGIAGFAGTTLLGDGRVLIVLDPRELLR
jgi:two-component system, chemotaxis family, sensor kinase CheA